MGHTLLALRLDGVVSGLAAAALLASVSLPLAIEATAGAPFWETATSLAYTVGDLVLFGAVVSAVALSGWRIDRMWALLGGAVLAWEAADLMYLFNADGSAGLVADALVATGAIGLAAAGYVDRGAPASRPPVAHGMLVPVGSGAVALGVLVLGAPLELNAAALALAGVALALALVRMGLALRENDKLLGESRIEAATDALTGLPNRRSLKADLAAALADGSPHVLVLLDLNGFKSYNDAFGHAAGDTVLTRLGAALARAAAGSGAAYRHGRRRVLCACRVAPERARRRSARCAGGADAERGRASRSTAAHGAVADPRRGTRPRPSALRARRRAHVPAQARAAAAGRAADGNVLTAVAEEHAPRPGRAHATRWPSWRYATARRDGGRGRRARSAALRGGAARHRQDGDPARDPRQARSARRRTSGSWSASTRSSASASSRARRRSSAAPGWCAGPTSDIDGGGYPDGLQGDLIPLARGSSPCDAFDAMITERPHAPARSPRTRSPSCVAAPALSSIRRSWPRSSGPCRGPRAARLPPS